MGLVLFHTKVLNEQLPLRIKRLMLEFNYYFKEEMLRSIEESKNQ